MKKLYAVFLLILAVSFIVTSCNDMDRNETDNAPTTPHSESNNNNNVNTYKYNTLVDSINRGTIDNGINNL